MDQDIFHTGFAKAYEANVIYFWMLICSCPYALVLEKQSLCLTQAKFWVVSEFSMKSCMCGFVDQCKIA